MKSRVERFKSLHERIDNTIDESTKTKELSSFANRLNKIDDQFEKMEVPDSLKEPDHARNFMETEAAKDPVTFDTFENEYLKDFLDEVKAYNVEKGHRTVEDTQSNILKELHSDIRPKRIISKPETIVPTDEGSTKEEWEDFTRRNRFKDSENDIRNIHNEVLELTQDLSLVEIEPLPVEPLVENLEEVVNEPLEEVAVETLEEVVDEPLEEEVVETGELLEDFEEPVVEAEIETDIAASQDLESISSDKVESKADTSVVEARDETSTSISDEELFEDFYVDMHDPANVRKSRVLNTAINLLLVGLVLGGAVLVKLFLFN